MTALSGLLQGYVNTVPHKRMVTDKIQIIEPLDIVAYSMLGTDMSKFNFVNRDEKTYEWLEDTYSDRVDSVATGLASGSTAVTCTITTAALYQPGDVWLVGSEQILVTAISGSVITITRGFGGSQDATHANAAVMTRVSRARHEGDDADDSPHTEVSSNYNYTQILQRTVNVSRTKQRLAQYGISDPVDRQIEKYMKELMGDLARMPYYGLRYVGTSALGSYAGGFQTFITDNITYATSTAATAGTAQALTADHIEDTLSNIWDDGGEPDLILTSSWAQKKLNKFYEGFITTERSNEIGGNFISVLQNPISGGMIKVVVDRNCPSDQMWMLSTNQIAYYPFDPFFYEELGKDGDYMKGEVVGEYGFVCGFDKSHGAIKEFSTSL